jgi:phosphopentomutase
MSRAFLVVLDSVGCGGAPDAAAFGDAGANTLGHIIQACAAGDADVGRSGPLHVPTMAGLGLMHAVDAGSGTDLSVNAASPIGLWGAATEVSNGKDTPSGHWEIAGVPVPWDWHYFDAKTDSFPPDVIAKTCEIAGVDGILGNCHASGTAIIEALGAEHVSSGKPICYTSVDSVFQIAAHEETFGLERLLDLCQRLAPMLHMMRVGRVIARPFLENAQDGFKRTTNRRDFAIAPPSRTLCDWVFDSGAPVYGIGKIGDIFSGIGITKVLKGGGDAGLMTHLNERVANAEEGALTFANFVEFDTDYGHQRDIAGYARALEWFDVEITKIIARLRPDDLLVLTADHGNDPSWTGTDHTRERVPILCVGAGSGNIGIRGFADIGASVAAHLNVNQGPYGESFL